MRFVYDKPCMSKSLDRLSLLQTFVRIADAGSISAAARDLGLSQPSVSRQLAELESRFKAQLMRRTTHDLSLTTAGAELLADARRLLDEWEALEEKHLEAEDARGEASRSRRRLAWQAESGCTCGARAALSVRCCDSVSATKS